MLRDVAIEVGLGIDDATVRLDVDRTTTADAELVKGRDAAAEIRCGLLRG
jgi:hypothetical protein